MGSRVMHPSETRSSLSHGGSSDCRQASRQLGASTLQCKAELRSHTFAHNAVEAASSAAGAAAGATLLGGLGGTGAAAIAEATTEVTTGAGACSAAAFSR